MFEHLYHDVERPSSGPIYSDEWIEFIAKIYLANPWIRARGVLFETFLAEPVAILRALAVPVHEYARALLRAQRAVQSRIDVRDAAAATPCEALAVARLERTGAHCENGRFIERLRHHRARS